MNAEIFYRAFLEMLKKENDKAISRYYKKNENGTKGETPWTVFANKNIFPDIIDRELKTYEKQILVDKKLANLEFYKIDVTGWTYLMPDMIETESDLPARFKRCGLKWRCWRMEVAVEHENDSTDWNYEVMKLLSIDCPLRVVIGYNNIKKRDDKEKGDANKLSLICEQIKEIGQTEKLERGEFLIIIGNSDGTIIENDILKTAGYRAYLYHKDKGFEPLIVKGGI